MEFGYSSMNTPNDMRPDLLARALEERGYTSFFVGEHPQIPVSRTTPFPAGGEMPDATRWMMDPFVSLAMAASVTQSLQLGFGVCLVLEHDVFALAKSVATLDRLSGGRVLFGVGVGWNVEELANHRPDIPWSRRYIASEECVGALRACWDFEESEFHGEYFNFDPLWSLPKPARRPPVLLGAGGRIGMMHAVRWADEWMPMDVALGDVAKKVGRFREAASTEGRDIPITLVTYGDPTPDTLRSYRDLGIERVVIGASREGESVPGTDLPFIDRYAPFIDELK